MSIGLRNRDWSDIRVNQAVFGVRGPAVGQCSGVQKRPRALVQKRLEQAQKRRLRLGLGACPVHCQAGPT
jgi:hypothetical protein